MVLACSSPRLEKMEEFSAPAPVRFDAGTNDKLPELSSYETEYKFKGKWKNRAKNIKLAAERLNGFTIEPGETLSFNEIVGERTVKRGFIEAPIYFQGIKTLGMGGGVCQVSSTLYAAAMHGRIKVIQRITHSRPSGYIPKGMDATVSYPDLDLKLENNYKSKLIIKTKTGEGKIRIAILGINKNFKVKHKFSGFKGVEQSGRFIEEEGYKGEPKLKQKGKPGLPGIAIWTYTDTQGETKITVPSPYRPVDDVWHIEPANGRVE